MVYYMHLVHLRLQGINGSNHNDGLARLCSSGQQSQISGSGHALPGEDGDRPSQRRRVAAAAQQEANTLSSIAAAFSAQQDSTTLAALVATHTAMSSAPTPNNILVAETEAQISAIVMRMATVARGEVETTVTSRRGSEVSPVDLSATSP